MKIFAALLALCAAACAQATMGTTVYLVNIDTIEQVRGDLQAEIDAIVAKQGTDEASILAIQNTQTDLQNQIAQLQAQFAAPVISGVSASCAGTSCTILWTTNVRATTQVVYGIVQGSPQSKTALNTSYVTSHSATVPACATPGTCWAYPISTGPLNDITRYTTGINY